MPSLLERVESHYSRFLGTTSSVRSITLKGHPEGHYHLIEYIGVPCEGAKTLATLGFCDVPLHMFRQEFLFLCYDQFISGDLIALLAFVAKVVSENNHPLLHGTVLPPAGPLLEYTSMEALYVGTLMYFNTSDESFDVLKADSTSVLISWLIPLHSSEAGWIGEHGYDAFEDLIIDRDPDLMDLERPPLV
jgi:hypothetical protein